MSLDLLLRIIVLRITNWKGTEVANSIIQIPLYPDGVNHWYFKLFHLIAIHSLKSKGLRHRISKIYGLENHCCKTQFLLDANFKICMICVIKLERDVINFKKLIFNKDLSQSDWINSILKWIKSEALSYKIGLHKGTKARKVNCGRVYSAYILKLVLSGRIL